MKTSLNLKPIWVLILILFQGCSSSPEETTENQEEDIYAEHVRTSRFQTPEEERQNFMLPEGFEVTLFASEPDITKPINMAFDEKWRLWVDRRT